MEAHREGTYPEIVGTEIIEAKSGDMMRIINSEKAREMLLTKGVELGATYKIDGPENPTITIAGISDDMFGFSAEDTQEKVESLRPNRAAVWVYVGDENKIGFYGYVKDYSKREDREHGFDLQFNGMKIKHRKTDDRVKSEVEGTSHNAMNLL